MPLRVDDGESTLRPWRKERSVICRTLSIGAASGSPPAALVSRRGVTGRVVPRDRRSIDIFMT